MTNVVRTEIAHWESWEGLKALLGWLGLKLEARSGIGIPVTYEIHRVNPTCDRYERMFDNQVNPLWKELRELWSINRVLLNKIMEVEACMKKKKQTCSKPRRAVKAPRSRSRR